MSANGTSILERLPTLVQNERRRERLRVTFDADIDVYTLPQAPVLIVHSVSDDEKEYTRGTDFALITNSDGDFVEIDWGVGGDSPDDGDDFIVDETFRTIIERYTAAHDEEFDFFDGEIEEVIESHDIDTANVEEDADPPNDLDRIGALFGALGKRRGRDDSEYRIYLRSVVQSFSGRGSVSGMRFAIASAIGTDPSNVEIVERFDELEYDIEIENVDTSFLTSAVNDLAELADPSVVQLDEAIIVIDTGGVLVGGDDVTVGPQIEGLGSGALQLDGGENLAGTVIDSFEDQDLSEYSGDTASYAVSQNQVNDGTYSLEVADGTNPELFSDTGLNKYPGSGEQFATDVYIPNGATAAPQIQFRMPDANNGYVFELSVSDNTLTAFAKDSGTLVQLEQVQETELFFDTWYRVEIRIDGQYYIRVFEYGKPNRIEILDFDDNTYNAEGIGFREGNGDFPCYWDNLRLL